MAFRDLLSKHGELTRHVFDKMPRRKKQWADPEYMEAYRKGISEKGRELGMDVTEHEKPFTKKPATEKKEPSPVVQTANSIVSSRAIPTSSTGKLSRPALIGARLAPERAGLADSRRKMIQAISAMNRANLYSRLFK